LTGTGTLTVSGTTTWTGGTLSGTGETVAQGGLTISGTNTKVLNQRTLTNAGTATWAGASTVLVGLGAVLNNTGTFDAQGDASVSTSGAGGTFAFNNTGPFTKPAGTGTTNFTFGTFNNTSPGTVQVQSGTLRLDAGGGSSTGHFSVAAGATLEFAG